MPPGRHGWTMAPPSSLPIIKLHLSRCLSLQSHLPLDFISRACGTCSKLLFLLQISEKFPGGLLFGLFISAHWYSSKMSLLDGVINDVDGLLKGSSDTETQETATTGTLNAGSTYLSGAKALAVTSLPPSDTVQDDQDTPSATVTGGLRVSSTAQNFATTIVEHVNDGTAASSKNEPDLETIASSNIVRTESAPPLRSSTISLVLSSQATGSVSDNTLSINSTGSIFAPTPIATLTSFPSTTSARPTFTTITPSTTSKPGVWSISHSAGVVISTLVVAGGNAESAQHDTSQGTNSIFTPGNKLFPLAIIAVVVAGEFYPFSGIRPTRADASLPSPPAIFFLITSTILLIRLFGWNRKRRNRKYTPSFSVYPSSRQPMFEPKYDDAETVNEHVASTRPYDPIASNLTLHRQASARSQYSQQSHAPGHNQGPALGSMQYVSYPVNADIQVPPLPGPVPRVTVEGGTGDFDRDRQAYDGAFFPSSVQGTPDSRAQAYLAADGTQQSSWRTLLGPNQMAGSPPDQLMVDGQGSPVPSFNTGRAFLHQPSQPPVSSEYTGSMDARLLGSNPSQSGGWSAVGRGQYNEESGSTSEAKFGSSEVSTRSGKFGKTPIWGSDRV